MRQLVAAVVCCLGVALATGCGEDDEKASDTQTTTVPEVTAPREGAPESTPSLAPAPPATTPAPPPPPAGDPDSGGAPAPSPAPPPAPDSPDNDRPPPPGSPAERFEKECEANPDKCG